MNGAGGKAICAGGDVAAVQIESIAGGSLPQDFFFEEYQLNNIIATMFERQGIPQIALWDGITMGGGVGLSVHGRFRVATEKTMFAKPGRGDLDLLLLDASMCLRVTKRRQLASSQMLEEHTCSLVCMEGCRLVCTSG